jgi:hypothetical protein
MNHPAASCEVSHFKDLIDFIEASFEEYNPKRFKKGENDTIWLLTESLGIFEILMVFFS